MRHALSISIAASVLTLPLAMSGCEAHVDEPAAQDRDTRPSGQGRQSALGQAYDAGERTVDRAEERDQEMQDMMDDMFND